MSNAFPLSSVSDDVIAASAATLDFSETISCRRGAQSKEKYSEHSVSYRIHPGSTNNLAKRELFLRIEKFGNSQQH
jgi:hypothetical protein